MTLTMKSLSVRDVDVSDAENWPAWKVGLFVLCTSISLFEFGYNTASIGGVMLYIDSSHTDCSHEAVCLHDDVEKGYMVSSCLFGACFGALVAGSLADKFGRRTVLLANNVFFIAGPLGMAFAPSVDFLVGARALCGFGVGISSALVHVYIGENVSAERRGEFGAILVMMGTGGILLANVAAWILKEQWRTVLGLAAIPSMMQLVLGPFIMPESPCWIRVQRRKKKALEAPLLGIDPADLSPWSKAMVEQDSVRSSQSTSSNLSGEASMPGAVEHILSERPLAEGEPEEEEGGGWKALWGAVKSGTAVQPLIIGIGLQVLQQIAGINVTVYYGPKIFTMTGFTNDESTFLTAILSCVQMAATLLLARVVDLVGRRPMSFVGLVLMIGSLVSLGTAFIHLDGNGQWVALISLMVYRVAFSLSLGPLPYIITAEIFPSSIRASGVSLCWFVNWVANACVSMTFLPLMQVLHTSGIFYMYSGVCVFAILFIKFCVAETKGQELDAKPPGFYATPP